MVLHIPHWLIEALTWGLGGMFIGAVVVIAVVAIGAREAIARGLNW